MAMFSIVSKNFDFLRWKYGTHKALVAKLKGIVNSAQLSHFANADQTASESTMQAVESHLRLPVGWCGRDNLVFTALAREDHELVTAVLACRPATKAALHALLATLRDDT